jgi:subtilisin family serine protease
MKHALGLLIVVSTWLGGCSLSNPSTLEPTRTASPVPAPTERPAATSTTAPTTTSQPAVTAPPAPVTTVKPGVVPSLLPLPEVFPQIDRKPGVSNFYRGVLARLPSYDPESEYWSQVDLQSYDLSRLDLRHSMDDLMYADFDTDTRWPPADKLPPRFDGQRVLELGKNPGIGIRQLHTQGITGVGVGIAIIDQALLVTHQEYAKQLRWYAETSEISPNTHASMHGPAVASIAVGKTVGVAPGADLYYIASTLCFNQATGKHDFSCLSPLIRRIMQLNQQLPLDHKIRVISLSIGWRPGNAGYADITAAVQEAKKAGLLVVYSSSLDVNGFKFDGLGRSPLADPDNPESYEHQIWQAQQFYKNPQLSHVLLIPMDSRTVASPSGIDDYTFYREGGASWAIPYIAGVYALAAQVKPAITPDEFWTLALQTGRTIQLKRNDTTIPFGPIIDPAALISHLQAQK